MDMTMTTVHRRICTVLCAAWAVVAFAAAGCSDNGGQPAGAAGPGDESAQPGKDQAPYYYGLIEEYRSVLAADPHNLAAIIGLANALFEAGQWREAIAHYEQALRLNPHNADVITDLGTCYRNLGRPDEALREYGRALKIEPTHQGALFHMGAVYGHDKKDYARAIETWERLLRLAPNHPRMEYLHAKMASFRKALRGGAR